MLLLTARLSLLLTCIVIAATAVVAAPAEARGRATTAKTLQCGGVRTPLDHKEGNYFYFTAVKATQTSCPTAVRVDRAIIARYCADAEDCSPPFGHETVGDWSCRSRELPYYEEGHRLANDAIECAKAHAKIVSIVDSGGGD